MYAPIASEGSNILGKYGVNYFDKLINPNVRDVVRDVIGKYPAEQIAADRTVISGELKALIGKKFEKMPFNLSDVSLRNIQLPQIVLQKVEEVQIAKQEEQKSVIEAGLSGADNNSPAVERDVGTGIAGACEQRTRKPTKAGP